jgi:hypothetical protein
MIFITNHDEWLNHDFLKVMVLVTANDNNNIIIILVILLLSYSSFFPRRTKRKFGPFLKMMLVTRDAMADPKIKY